MAKCRARRSSIFGAAPPCAPAARRLPTASMGRSRVDVTWRISGLFRDLFPAQIALIDAAVRAVAAREEEADENPLAAAGSAGAPIARIFGTAPGVYGAGVEDLLGRDIDRRKLGATYLAAGSHAYGGAEGDAMAAPGGFAAAASALGRAPDLIILDTTDPTRPRARSLSAALARIVRSRATNPKFITGQLRHGPRGAAELAETVDRLVDFAEATGAVANHLFDLVHDAYVADDVVRSFLVRENPAAATAIARRLDAARRRGLWHPRRNEVDAGLQTLMNETAP